MSRNILKVLTDGDLTLLGRIPTASNLTLACRVGADELLCVYKPVRGEAPLWDFPDGTLAGREVAAYLLSDALGWGIVPETVLRESGPADADLGPGMLQRWIHVPDETVGRDPVDLVPIGDVGDDVIPILRAYDEDGSLVALVHSDTPELKRLAVFDVVVNNADRKGGHILVDESGELFGIDHGICLHTDDKLRTVLWGWAGQAVPSDLLDDLTRVAAHLSDDDHALTVRLGALITADEIRALRERVSHLVDGGTMPLPPGERAIPWPPF
ncbi:SCO1664 family protein [Gordonia sp. PDNC005]|uniref:SCO1664 family protein n=1 Tax=unclassified Gordonia (in: high G+C Gram-positive bacteria) TaxID=2657482 RepID=UPI00196550CC|nr:SCO1664 family protein [Gordonia sp. PDNC005]QRY64128.1 SCO1664 family protein [Gordonia sp. PDNC005]